MINSEVPNDIVANVSYSVVFDLAKFFLDMDISVIIDTPCYYEESLNNGIQIANMYCAVYKYIECKVDDYSIIKERISNRKRLVTQIANTTEESFKNSKDKSKKPSDRNYLVIDTTLDNDYNMEIIRRYLEVEGLKCGKGG